jgi:hypothetical protein
VRDLAAWRAAGLEVMAFEAEVAAVGRAEIDIVLDRKSKLTRTIDFLPMGGVTEGTCLMRLKNKPSTVFFGPALEPGADGWPTLVFHDDDHSYESRLFGALGLADLQFEHAFTDVFVPGQTRHGPAAGAEVRPRVSAVVEAD